MGLPARAGLGNAVDQRLELSRKLDLYATGFLFDYGLARVLFEKGEYAEAKTLAEQALRRPTRDPATLPWVYFGLAMVAKGSADSETLRWAVDAALTADAAAGGATGAAAEVRALVPADSP